MSAMTAVPPQLTPDQLTVLLRRAGVLAHGEVSEVAVETARDTLISHIVRLRLTYAGDAGPSHVFFKTRRAGGDPALQQFGRKEAAFYLTVAGAMPAGLLPRCYDAVAEPDHWHLLLEDLTVSHEASADWPLPPPIERFNLVLDAHARFHAAWWNDARLGTLVGGFADDTGALERSLASFPKEVATFADRLGDRLSAERKRIYERVIAAASRLCARYRSHAHMTIVHGDAHVWNALLPRDPGGRDVRLIDWDAARLGVASDDLAYMMATHFFPDWRRRHEQESLRRYHGILVAHGVRDYSFEALVDDYRLSALWQIATPMWQANHGLPPWIWWNHLERVMAAVHDLGCLELLD